MADRRLQVFHAVARQLSFTKAAESLFMTQPAVTFQIKQLEEQYNTRLFERGPRRHRAHAGRRNGAPLRRTHTRTEQANSTSASAICAVRSAGRCCSAAA